MNIKKLGILLNGIAIGNLFTSAIFYSEYGPWQPLVYSAIINAVILVAIAAVRAMNERYF